MRTVTAMPRLGPDTRREDPDPADSGFEVPIGMAAGTVGRREALSIFIGFGLLYALVGLLVVGSLHVIDLASLERLAGADLVWHGDPPKLAAIGFEHAPVGTLLLLPFALIPGLVTSTLAIPLASALCAAGALVFIDRTLALGAIARNPRLLLVGLIAINPMFVLYAIDGPAESAGLLFAAIGLYCLLNWGATSSPRHLVAAGLAFALGALTDYELIIWALVAGLAVSGTLTMAGRARSEIEGSVIAFLAPVMYALGIWLLLSGVILGDPFAWIGSENAVGAFDLGDGTLDSLRAHMIFPAAIAAIALMVRYARDPIGIAIGTLAVVSVGYPVATALVDGSAATVDLRSALPAVVIGCAGISWAHLRSPESRPLIQIVAIVLVGAALPLAWWQMETNEHQGVEKPFTRAISTGEDQEGTASIAATFEIGLAPEREMARYIDELDIAGGRVITDEDSTFGVIAVAGEPGRYLTEAGSGDEEWERSMADPGAGDYALIDLGTTSIEVDGFEPLVANDRYALLRAIGP